MTERSTSLMPSWATSRIWIQHQCPRCDSVKFKPAEARWFDPLLAFVAIRAVRCMFCWRRYYWFSLHEA